MNIKYIQFHSIDSTQEYCINNLVLLYKFFEEYKAICIYADQQTAGRGKFGSIWESPVGNLYTTYALPLKTKVSPKELIHRSTLAVACAMEELKIYPQIKWLNDLLINQKKVSGIICDVIQYKQHYIVLIGIGMNLAHNPAPEYFASVHESSSELISAQLMLSKISEKILDMFNLDWPIILKGVSERMAYKDCQIFCIDNTEELVGYIKGLDSNGNLVMDIDNQLHHFENCRIRLYNKSGTKPQAKSEFKY